MPSGYNQGRYIEMASAQQIYVNFPITLKKILYIAGYPLDVNDRICERLTMWALSNNGVSVQAETQNYTTGTMGEGDYFQTYIIAIGLIN